MSATQVAGYLSSSERLHLLKEYGFFPRTILDIGAYRGDWTRQVCQTWPEARIFMVEANEDCRPVLSHVKEAAGFAIALLGKRPQKNALYFAAKHPIATSGNSIYRENTRFFEDPEVRYLDMTTLDLLVSREKLKNIDLVKIDTQGSELDIVAGGRKTIAKAEFVLLETQNLEYNRGAPTIAKVMTAMEALGFRLFDVVEIHYLITGEMVQLDLLFARVDSRFIRKGFDVP